MFQKNIAVNLTGSLVNRRSLIRWACKTWEESQLGRVGFCLCKELAEDQFRGFINVLHFTAVVSVFACCRPWKLWVALCGVQMLLLQFYSKENSLLACHSFSTLYELCPKINMFWVLSFMVYQILGWLLLRQHDTT